MKPDYRILRGVAAAMLLVAPVSAQAADSLLNFGDLEFLHIYHAFSASDGKTYIEEMAIPAQPIQSGGKSAQLYLTLNPKSVAIARSASGSMIDWHHAGENRHLLLPQQGDLVFDTGDGKLFHLKAGEAMLAEDWAGRGHRSGCLATNGTSCVVLDMVLDATPRNLPLRDPPHKP